MIVHYIEQSREHYKDFDLVLYPYNLDPSNPLRMHRTCKLFYKDKALAQSKTKKELKDLIDHGLYDKYKNPTS